MADLKVTRFVIDGKTFAIPAAGAAQAGLMSASDYSKLAGVSAGAQANVLEGVKVNGQALAIAQKMVDLLFATGATNGTLAVNGTDIAVKGLAALAYKAQVAESDLDEALAAVLSGLSANVTAIGGKVDTLNGTGAGSVTKAISDAFAEFTTNVSNDGVVNSYKELVDWAAAHGGDAAELAEALSTLQSQMAGIGGAGEPVTVQAAIAKALESVSIGNYYNKSEADARFVAKAEGMGLSSNDFTAALKTKLEGISAGATATAYSYDPATETLTLTGINAG